MKSAAIGAGIAEVVHLQGRGAMDEIRAAHSRYGRKQIDGDVDPCSRNRAAIGGPIELRHR